MTRHRPPGPAHFCCAAFSPMPHSSLRALGLSIGAAWVTVICVLAPNNLPDCGLDLSSFVVAAQPGGKSFSSAGPDTPPGETATTDVIRVFIFLSAETVCLFSRLTPASAPSRKSLHDPGTAEALFVFNTWAIIQACFNRAFCIWGKSPGLPGGEYGDKASSLCAAVRGVLYCGLDYSGSRMGGHAHRFGDRKLALPAIPQRSIIPAMTRRTSPAPCRTSVSR